MDVLKSSFTGGELSDAMYGRVDLAKYDSGAAKLKNYKVLRYGGASVRKGFKHIAKTAGGKRAFLVPFSYSADQNYCIELTAGKCRFYTKDGILVNADNTPYEISNNLTDADLAGTCKLKVAQNADVLFIVHPDHKPISLTRYGALNWVWADLEITNGPFDDYNTKDIKISASAVTGNSITLTATGNVFGSHHVGSYINLTHSVGSQYIKGIPGANTMEVDALPQAGIYVESFGFWSGDFIIQKQVDGVWQEVRRQYGNHSQNYTIQETNKSDEIVKYRVTTTGFDRTIWEDENDKQQGYVTIQCVGNEYVGIAKIKSVQNATHATADVVLRLGDTAATKVWAISPWNSVAGYPSAVGFYEDRLVMASNKKKPQTFWTSKTGDYYNFGSSVVSQDDDGITATLNSGKLNGIRDIITFNEMVMMTAEVEFTVSGGQNKAMTPSNINRKAQEYRGINYVTPVVIGNRIIYVQEQGNIVRDLGYSYDVDKYTGDDLNLLAEHLFAGHSIVGMAYQQIPDSIVWFVRDDGVLLGLTYIKEQEVFAWHQHNIGGGTKFVNLCAMKSDTVDLLYACIERGGQHYIVYMDDENYSKKPEDQFYVDDGYTFTNVSEITGLTWLNGLTVSILADGNVLPQRKVVNNKVSLGHTYSKVHIGIPIDAEIRTLPLEFLYQGGSTLTKKKRVAQLGIMFKDSRGGRYGVDANHLDEIKWRSTEALNEAIQLKTEKKVIPIAESSWADTVQVIIRQEEPLPMTVLALVPEVT